MSNKPTKAVVKSPGVTRGVLWASAAAMVFTSGTTLGSSDNTAVLLRSDLVPDGVINWRDLNAYLTAMNSRSMLADLNGDGVVNALDTNVMLANLGKSVKQQNSDANAADSRDPDGSKGEGESSPPAETPVGAHSVSLGNNSLDFTQGDYQILSHRGAIWRPDRGGLDADIDLVEQDGGFDLVFTMQNNKRRAQKLGSVVLDGFRLGQAIKVRDFRAAGVDIALDDDAAEPIRDGLSYPSEWYSPVMVLQSDIYTLGVSIQYPVLDYKHEARLSVRPSGGDSQRIEIELNDRDGPVGYSRDGEVQQHEVRRYVVSVRVLPASEEEWITVLEPYREYFRDMYGDAEYDRDPRPVHAVVMASPDSQDITNRGGFIFEDLRPDVHGFGPWMNELDARARMGWERFMLWRMTGLPSTSRGHNAGCSAFEFASPLLEGPMQDAFSELPRFDSRGKNLGMWWGDPMRTADARRANDFKMSNAQSVADALHEVQTAAQAGAETIGLERFNTLPAWEAYHWIDELRAAAPGVEYITQPACGDLIHTRAGVFMTAQPGSDESPSMALDTRFFLADYLIPGHETWGLIRVDRLVAPDDEGVREEIFRLAEHGFVPVVVPPIDVDRRIVAEETWRDPEW